MGPDQAPGGGRSLYPYTVTVFPRHADKFPPHWDIQPAPRGRTGPWQMNRQDGWSMVGHWAATTHPHRDVGPQRTIESSQRFERRFSTVRNIRGRGLTLILTLTLTPTLIGRSEAVVGSSSRSGRWRRAAYVAPVLYVFPAPCHIRCQHVHVYGMALGMQRRDVM